MNLPVRANPEHIQPPYHVLFQKRGSSNRGVEPFSAGGPSLKHFGFYDEAAQLQNGTLADYLTPMSTEMPDIDVAHVQTLTTESELGAKGAGESGTGAAAAAVLDAVNDALRPFEARVWEQPISPEVVLTALGKI